VERVLANVCPNCGGGFQPRPIRPAGEWRPGISCAKRPPSAERVRMSYAPGEVKAFSERLKNVPPAER
jgi:uncharacterized protein